MKVTILMGVYNGEKYLQPSMESMLAQSFSDFEFLIINDGSTDRSKEIIQGYTDSRIRYIENEQNLGLSATLNKGIELADGEYIARMDCDDISLPQRLEKQVAFLDQHPEVGIVGTWAQVLGSETVYKYPEKHQLLITKLLDNSMLCHPAVMMNKKLLNAHRLRYDTNYKYSQDYDLWARAQYCFELANIGEVLLHYREHAMQMKQTFSNFTKSEPNNTRLMLIQKFANIDASDPRLLYYRQVLDGSYQFNKDSFKNLNEFLHFLETKNEDSQIYDLEYFQQIVLNIWLRSIISIKQYNLEIYRIVKKSIFYKRQSFPVKAAFLIKCLILKIPKNV